MRATLVDSNWIIQPIVPGIELMKIQYGNDYANLTGSDTSKLIYRKTSFSLSSGTKL
nr:hypothetical protein [Legionella antarctica]